jgi:peptidylprolyl isomerase
MRGLLLAALLALPASAAPVLRPERVILRTDAGDMVLALYAGAPRHAAKLIALFRDGAYDTVPVTKLDPTRFAAFGGIGLRRMPLPAGSALDVKRLPVESGGPHRAGVVAMAHQPGDADLDETAFVILFADIPSMDGRFSAVGEVVGGRDALEALKSAPVDGASRPVASLEIRGSSVLQKESGLANAPLRAPDFKALGRDETAARRQFLVALGALLFASGLGLWLKGGRGWSSAGLLICLAGFFSAFAALADLSASIPWLSVALFASTVAVFRLMGRFER